MARVKNFYHDELERRRCIENERCGQCGEEADLGAEAWKYGLCRDCFDESNNGLLGAGA